VACPHLNIVKRILYGSLATILLIPGAYAALPGDIADGQRLHEANCTGCHNTGVYTRQNRQVRTLDALKQQLEGCGHVAKKEFSVAETQNIIKLDSDNHLVRFSGNRSVRCLARLRGAVPG
jgi:hypothetical protein